MPKDSQGREAGKAYAGRKVEQNGSVRTQSHAGTSRNQIESNTEVPGVVENVCKLERPKGNE